MECSAAIIASDLIHGTFFGTSGTVFEDPSARVESTTPVYSGMLHGRNPISKSDGSVFPGTGQLVARSEEVNMDTFPTPRFARTSSTEPHRLQISELHYDKFLHFLVLEDKSRNRSMCLFRFTLGGNVMEWTILNHRAQFEDVISRISRCWMRRLPQP